MRLRNPFGWIVLMVMLALAGGVEEARAQEGCRGCAPDGEHCLLGCVRGDPNSCADVCLVRWEPPAGCYQSFGCATYPQADGTVDDDATFLAWKLLGVTSDPHGLARRDGGPRRSCDGARIGRVQTAEDARRVRERTAWLTL